MNHNTALITGAGSGIGAATARKFLSRGWRVIALGRRLEPLLELEGMVLPISCDLRNSDSIASAIQSIIEHDDFARSLKVLVNNAGIYLQGSLSESTDEQWLEALQSNLLGPVRLTRGLWSILVKNHGSVLNISSTLGLRPKAATGAYSASKAALINWTQTLALEGAPFGVRSSVICPGFVDTPIHSFHHQSSEEKKAFHGLQPLGRLGTPEDVAHAVWSLAVPEADWITGAVLKVDGGIDLI